MTTEAQWGSAQLMTKVALLYHEGGMRQSQIAERLHLSQPTVSRLLSRARAAGIVRTSVVPPAGIHSELEDALQEAFGLLDAVVVGDAPAVLDLRHHVPHRRPCHLLRLLRVHLRQVVLDEVDRSRQVALVELVRHRPADRPELAPLLCD
jgi:DNA-binding transcriptional ArsR family regulator